MSDSGDGMRNPDAWKKVRRFSVLDPAGEKPGSVFPTVYVTDELLIDRGRTESDARKTVQELAERSGWTLEEIADDTRDLGERDTIRMRLGIAPGRERVAAAPDAWALLRHLRPPAQNTPEGEERPQGCDEDADGGAKRVCGVSLNHVLTTDSFGANPYTANPYTANPYTANPYTANPYKANAGTVGLESYGQLGSGGRQPVTYLGRAPGRRYPQAVRPIVAVLDTGCGDHPWLNAVRIEPRLSTGVAIGIEPLSETDPELHPSFADQSLGESMDGLFDDAAGHGTFIAGIIHQECPDALILPVRVADGDGVILENELIETLQRLLDFMDDVALEKKRGGSQVKVLNLSFSFYHEKPGDADTLSELQRLLERIREHDCVVVCSAGNEATSRRTYPAAIPTTHPDHHISVGALNPSDRSVALFSNVGDWVDVYAPGVSVLSTLPVCFNGGVQAGTKDDQYGRHRETLDLDDFRGGFGAWSGTSFAAPVIAGRIADQIVRGASPDSAKKTVVSEFQARDLSRKV